MAVNLTDLLLGQDRQTIKDIIDAEYKITGGTYSAVITNTINIDSIIAYHASYQRIKNIVTVSVRMNLDPTAAGPISFYISLPIPTNHLGTTVKAHGVGVLGSTVDHVPLVVLGENSSVARALVQGDTALTGSMACSIDFQYEVV